MATESFTGTQNCGKMTFRGEIESYCIVQRKWRQIAWKKEMTIYILHVPGRTEPIQHSSQGHHVLHWWMHLDESNVENSERSTSRNEINLPPCPYRRSWRNGVRHRRHQSGSAFAALDGKTRWLLPWCLRASQKSWDSLNLRSMWEPLQQCRYHYWTDAIGSEGHQVLWNCVRPGFIVI